jgi:hypothetical protein
VARKIKEQCSFCGKRRDQVRKLIAGPGVFICDQCVELANEIVREEGPPAPEPPVRRSSSRRQSLSGWFRNLFQVGSYTT